MTLEQVDRVNATRRAIAVGIDRLAGLVKNQTAVDSQPDFGARVPGSGREERDESLRGADNQPARD